MPCPLQFGQRLMRYLNDKNNIQKYPSVQEFYKHFIDIYGYKTCWITVWKVVHNWRKRYLLLRELPELPPDVDNAYPYYDDMDYLFRRTLHLSDYGDIYHCYSSSHRTHDNLDIKVILENERDPRIRKRNAQNRLVVATHIDTIPERNAAGDDGKKNNSQGNAKSLSGSIAKHSTTDKTSFITKKKRSVAQTAVSSGESVSQKQQSSLKGVCNLVGSNMMKITGAEQESSHPKRYLRRTDYCIVREDYTKKIDKVYCHMDANLKPIDANKKIDKEKTFVAGNNLKSDNVSSETNTKPDEPERKVAIVNLHDPNEDDVENNRSNVELRKKIARLEAIFDANEVGAGPSMANQDTRMYRSDEFVWPNRDGQYNSGCYPPYAPYPLYPRYTPYPPYPPY